MDSPSSQPTSDIDYSRPTELWVIPRLPLDSRSVTPEVYSVHLGGFDAGRFHKRYPLQQYRCLTQNKSYIKEVGFVPSASQEAAQTVLCAPGVRFNFFMTGVAVIELIAPDLIKQLVDDDVGGIVVTKESKDKNCAIAIAIEATLIEYGYLQRDEKRVVRLGDYKRNDRSPSPTPSPRR